MAVLVGRWLNGSASFVLQYRAVDKGLEETVHSTSPDVMVGVVAEVHIQFCPWCGCNLSDAYENAINELVRPGLLIQVPGLDEPGLDEPG